MNSIQFLQKNSFNTFTSHPLQLQLIKAISGVGDEPQFICEVANYRVIPAIKRSLAAPSLSSGLGKAFDEELRLQISNTVDSYPCGSFQLAHFVGRVLYFSTVNCLFGPSFHPDLQSYEDFQLLDSNIPNLSSGLHFVGWRALRARDRLMNKFVSYLAPIWHENGADNVEEISRPIGDAISELKGSQCSQQQAAAALMCMLYGAITNLQYMTFWLMANLITNGEAMGRVCDEIDGLKLCETPDILDSSITPLLDSAIQETLRWAARSSTFRIVETDTEIRTNGVATMARKGECVMANIHAVHYDPSTYNDPEMFKVDRYFDPKTAPPKPIAWGGGEQMVSLFMIDIRSTLISMLSVQRKASGSI
ncbi:hypothetical protein NLJ89_g3082 [Agrocybe chaxingu]|uniref:Cytochrome P450 n=1 Tax=Agrocybe chaxingu TaxID=84603 RepID=A0A9W8K605_9AGAR|nr:hypothetical protein NLJ89_g3082 [Agrocybe chaxingu]